MVGRRRHDAETRVVVGWGGLGLDGMVGTMPSSISLKAPELLWSPRIGLTTLKPVPMGSLLPLVSGMQKIHNGGLRPTWKTAGWFLPGHFQRLKSCCLLKMKSSVATKVRLHAVSNEDTSTLDLEVCRVTGGVAVRSPGCGAFSWSRWESFTFSKDIFAKVAWPEFNNNSNSAVRLMWTTVVPVFLLTTRVPFSKDPFTCFFCLSPSLSDT